MTDTQPERDAQEFMSSAHRRADALPQVTALDREAAATTPTEAMDFVQEALGRRVWLRCGPGDIGNVQKALDAFLARHRTAAERATSPAGDAGEVERLREAVLTANTDDPMWRGVLFNTLVTALRPQAGDADVVGEPGA